MTKITYLVHGTTTDNENNIATGWLPGELSELGIKQAKQLGEDLKDEHFDAVFCADVKRAIDTADLAFKGKYEIITDKRLREADYGDFSGKPNRFKDNLKDYIYSPFPNGESYQDVEKRVKDLLDYIKKNYQGKHVAFLAHQAPQLALEVLLKGKTWEQAIDEDWRNTKSYQPGWEYSVEF